MGTRRLQDPDHAMHCLLVEIFGDLAPRSFRFMVPRSSSRGVLYGYGNADADELRDAAGTFAEPLQMRIIPSSEIACKPMPSQFQPGKRLGFEARVRPVIRKARGSERAGAEMDAYQLTAESYPKGEMPLTREEVYRQWLSDRLEQISGAVLELEQTMLMSFQRVRSFRKRRGRYVEGPDAVEEVYRQWLSDRLEQSCGAVLEQEQTRLVSFQRVRSFRKRRGRYVEGPDAVLRGVLSVTDPSAFAHLLSRGVGRHRAYGYGMLLLRPPGRSNGP
jgi:CRISPR system Cascade subunit CasE